MTAQTNPGSVLPGDMPTASRVSLQHKQADRHAAVVKAGAATMPDNTVVFVSPGGGRYPSARTVVYIKNHPASDLQWRGTDGSHMWDAQIDTFFAEGRAVVMVAADPTFREGQ